MTMLAETFGRRASLRSPLARGSAREVPKTQRFVTSRDNSNRVAFLAAMQRRMGDWDRTERALPCQGPAPRRRRVPSRSDSVASPNDNELDRAAQTVRRLSHKDHAVERDAATATESTEARESPRVARTPTHPCYVPAVATVEHGDFEWDVAKAAANEKKHGVSFVEAATVFEDVDRLINVDPLNLERFIAVGFSSAARVLVVVHATRAERLRLISARRATLREERLYVERRGQ